jgi:hypothetical protein
MSDSHPQNGPVELQRRIAGLEQKLERRDQALHDAFAEFQSLLYVLTHDFRAPLRAILTSCAILKEDWGDSLGPEGISEIARQEASVRRLNGLLEELLKVSRLSRHEFGSKEVDLAVIARAAWSNDSEPEQGALEIEEGVQLVADPELLKMALQQLFDNSRKFACKDRPLKVHVGASEGRIYVRDNGIGFDPAHAERVFLPFERLGRDDYPGAGIGLTIFKRIVNWHGGRTGFESSPGNGTTIWFDLGS